MYPENIYKHCELCPRECGVNRTREQKGEAGKNVLKSTGYCRMDDRLRVARAALHMWEEPCISGESGSGAVFFSGCNLRCVYCQNHEIAEGKRGKEITQERLCQIFLELQSKGAANINLVTPDHYVPDIVRAVLEARDRGLTIPIVYNGSGYEKEEIIASLKGIVDIFLTDFKYMEEKLAADLSHAGNYPEVAKKALACMLEITGTPAFDKRGMMQKGVIVRHLLLPGHKQNAKAVLQYLWETYGDQIYISLMSQYTPMKRMQDLSSQSYPELYRKVTKREYEQVVAYALELGITNAFIQEGDVAKESFIPPFDGNGV